jgi:hypothetical protein
MNSLAGFLTTVMSLWNPREQDIYELLRISGEEMVKGIS